MRSDRPRGARPPGRGDPWPGPLGRGARQQRGLRLAGPLHRKRPGTDGRHGPPQRRGRRRPDQPLHAGNGRARPRRSSTSLRSRPSSRSRAPATYAASKAFVLSFSEALHTEQRGSGVTVTAVCPGPVKTEFTDVAGMSAASRTKPRRILDVRRGNRPPRDRGTDQGKRVVVPGALNRAQSLVGQHSPRALALPLIDRIWGSATRGSLER